MTNRSKTKSPVKNSIKLARAALRIVHDDKKVIGLAAMSAGTVFIILCAVTLMVVLGWSTLRSFAAQGMPEWVYYIAGALLMFILFYVGVFFNAAITAIALHRFEGERITLGQSLQLAARHNASLLGFAGLSASVGLVLNVISDRVPFAGAILRWLGIAAWNIATIFAVPVIMRGDETGPIQAVRRSSRSFIAIWKESVFVGVSLGLINIAITMVLIVLVLGLLAAAAALSSMPLVIIAVTLLIVVSVGLGLIMSALRAVVMSAAYYYAATGKLPAGFDEELIRSMFKPKKKWLKV